MVSEMLEQLSKKVAGLEEQLSGSKRLLECLRKEKNFYKQKASIVETVISGCQNFFYMYDREGRYIYASPAGAEMLGMGSDEMAGRTCRELGFPHGPTEPFLADIERVFVTGQATASETVFPTVSGEGVYEYVLDPVRDGAVVYVVATVREVPNRKKPESELAGQYSMMEAIFENTLFPLAVLDRHFNFVRVNEAYARADDREAADFPGHNHFDLYPSEAKDIFEQVVKAKEPCQVIARPFVYQNNPERGVTYWDWTLVPVLDSSGEVDKLILSLLDVTRSIRGEIALRNTLMETRRRNEEISALLKSSRAVLECKNFKDAALAIYESCRDLLAATAGYICIKNRDGENEALYLEAGDRLGTVEPLLPMPERGLSGEAYRTGNIVWENNFPGSRWVNLLPEGHIPLDNVLYAPLVVEGETWGLMAFGNKPGGFAENDIKMVSALSRDAAIALYNSRLLESLRHSEEHFRSVVQSATDAIITTDSAGTILFWNDAATTVFGYSGDEAVGSPLTLIMPEEFQRQLVDGVGRSKGKAKLSLSGEPLEKVGLRKDGLEVPVEVSVSCWESNGDVYLTEIVRDISGRKKMEIEMARLDRLNLVGQMAAVIGHEIRNPMTSVRGFLQILAGKSECDSYRGYFDLMIEELDRANTIIAEFLSLARNKTPETRMYSINRVVEALSPLLTADALNSKKDIAFELGEVPEISLDEKEIRQLILNFARNGLEAMTCGGKLTIKTFLEGSEVVLAVQDQGEGISDEIMEHIGVPFFTTKENGTGLGLATCYSIARRHNAGIQVETCSSGTAFMVRFRGLT